MLLLDRLIHTQATSVSSSSSLPFPQTRRFEDRNGESKIAKLHGFGSSCMDSSPAASLKRARGLSSAVHAPCCLVDGCRNDLRNCREYHRRHKVCELHSKTPKVTIAGQEQRFCQQCSRFHSLGEFDEEKRSCRKRLDGHNRRRRKPQPEPLSLNSGRYLSTYQGTSFSPFHSPPPMFATVAMTSPAMAGANSESNIMLYSTQSQSILPRKSRFTGSPSHSYASGKEISFIHGPNFPEPSLSNQSFIGSNSGTSNSGVGNEKVFSEWLRRDNSVDSNCALSLLSSAPACSTKETGSSHLIVQPNASVGPRFYDGFGNLNEPLMNSAFVSDRGENTGNLHCQEMFDIRADGSSRSSHIPP